MARGPVTRLLLSQTEVPDVERAPWKPLVRHQARSFGARKVEIDVLRTRAQSLLRRASNLLGEEDETPRDMSRASYGRQMAWRRSCFGSTIGAQKMDPWIDLRPPRDCFIATQAHSLLNLVTSVADVHHQRQREHPRDPRKPYTKKAAKIPPPPLLPRFSIYVKQRPLSKTYYLEGSLHTRRESQIAQKKEIAKSKKPERDRFSAAGSRINREAKKSTVEGPTGIRNRNARKTIIEKADEYKRSFQSKRELSHRASEYVKEKRRTRATLMAERERRKTEIKAVIASARRSSQLTIIRGKTSNIEKLIVLE